MSGRKWLKMTDVKVVVVVEIEVGQNGPFIKLVSYVMK